MGGRRGRGRLAFAVVAICTNTQYFTASSALLRKSCGLKEDRETWVSMRLNAFALDVHGVHQTFVQGYR
jgi:hypothetical protein